jgi:Putative zinc-finger
MSCRWVRRRLSEHLDGELSGAESQRVAAHLESCPGCAGVWASLRETVGVLARIPRREPGERIASRVLNRLEVETRGPGLALIFRSARAARPLMLPSLVPASLFLLVVLAGALALDREARPQERIATGVTAWEGALPASGTEGNPLLPSSGVSLPQARSGGGLSAAAVAHLGESTLFVETVVARDGSVSFVRLVGGDSERAEPFLAMLRRERFEPGRYRGRPVAVSVYRLISSLEVRPPLT